jgi:hypothetical protein
MVNNSSDGNQLGIHEPLWVESITSEKLAIIGLEAMSSVYERL